MTKPVRYKVSRGVYRTKAETRELLGLPKGYPIKAEVCKQPTAFLLMLADRMNRPPDEVYA